MFNREILLWDHHPIHLRKIVQAFIAAPPRLHVYEFPTGIAHIRRSPSRLWAGFAGAELKL